MPVGAGAATLHVLADDDPRWRWDPVEQAVAACEGGAGVVQLRAKHTGDRLALGWAREIRRLSLECGVRFFVNDRFDLAHLAGADGVHLGQADLPPDRIPPALGAGLQIGLSTHELRQARRAARRKPWYLAFGPVFGTRSKESPYAARGLARLARVAQAVAPCPLVAIGGIDAERAGSVLAAGAAGLAVISAVAGAEDPLAATRELAALFGAGA